MSITKSIWFNIASAIVLMFIICIVTFSTFYGAGVSTASTASFIMFAIMLIITFVGYKRNYRAVPTKRQIKKYSGDYEALSEDRIEGGKRAWKLILIYLVPTLVCLTFSLLLTYVTTR